MWHPLFEEIMNLTVDKLPSTLLLESLHTRSCPAKLSCISEVLSLSSSSLNGSVRLIQMPSTTTMNPRASSSPYPTPQHTDTVATISSSDSGAATRQKPQHSKCGGLTVVRKACVACKRNRKRCRYQPLAEACSNCQKDDRECQVVPRVISCPACHQKKRRCLSKPTQIEPGPKVEYDDMNGQQERGEDDSGDSSTVSYEFIKDSCAGRPQHANPDLFFNDFFATFMFTPFKDPDGWVYESSLVYIDDFWG